MTASSNFNSVAGLLSTLGITAVVAAGAAYVLFRYLGDKWLTGKFNERLEAFKHAQQRQLEQLRLRINTAFDRTVKLHTNEFEVLPELWRVLNEAFDYVASLTSPLQEIPDLDRLSGPALEHFLSESELPDYQRDELRASSERTKMYQSLRFWQSHQTVFEKYRAFESYFTAKRIFIQPVIIEKVAELSGIMWDALREKELEERFHDPREGRWEKGRHFRKDGPALRDAIGQAIQQRLWSSAAISSEDVEPEPEG